MTTQILSIILTIALVAIIAFALLAFLIGFLKGLHKTLIKTIIKIIGIIIAIFIAPVIASLISNLDITFIVEKITNEDRVGITTLQSFIADMIYQTGLVSPINGIAIYETCFSIANSLITFVVFFLELVVIQLFISLVTAIIYNGIIRWIWPVETRKEKKKRKKADINGMLEEGLLGDDDLITTSTKVRKKHHLLQLPGGILGFVQEFLFVSLMLMPFSAIFKVASKNKENITDIVDVLGLPEDQKGDITDFISTVEDHPLFKLLGFGNLDTALLNRVSTVKLGENEINLSTLVDATFDIATPLIKDKKITFDLSAKEVTINFSALLSTVTIDSLISKIVTYPMVMALIPPFIDVALNSISNTEFQLDKLDFSSIDWSNELTILNGIYDNIYSSAIKPMLNEYSLDFNNFSIDVASLSDKEKDDLVSAFESVGRLNMINDNMAVILSGIGSYLSSKGLDILPRDTNDYKGIDWEKDFGILGRTIIDFFSITGMKIDSSLNDIVIGDKTMSAIKEKSKRDQIKKLVLGDETQEGLFDSDLFSKISLADIINSVFNSIPSIKKYVQSINFHSALDKLDSIALKDELNIMFDIASIVLDESSAIDINNLQAIDLSSREITDELATLLSRGEKSEIFSSLFPDIVKSMLFNNSFNFDDFLFGLTPYDFNYEAEDFISNFRDLLLLLPDTKRMIDDMNDNSLTEAQMLQKVDTDVLRRLLYIVVSSDFFNPEAKIGKSNIATKNANIHTLLSNVLGMDAFKSLKIHLPSLENMSDIDWGSGVKGDNGEIDKLCSSIDAFKRCSSFLMSDGYNLTLLDDPSSVSDFIKSGIDSQLLSESINRILEDSIGQYFKKLGIPLSINDMRNSMWKDDADDIAKILKLIKDLNLRDIKLDTIDPNVINSLLTLLHDTNMIKTSTSFKDPFGYTLYSLLLKQGLYQKLSINSPDLNNFALDDINTWSVSTSSISLDDSGELFEITSQGEIYQFTLFLSKCQEIGFEKLSGGKLPDGFIKAISPCMDSYIIKNLMASILQATLNKVDMPDEFKEFIDSISLLTFKNMKSTQCQKELVLFDHFYRLSSEKIGSQSKLSYIFKNLNAVSNTLSYPDITDTTDPRFNKTLFDEFVDLINELHSSDLLLSKKDGYTFSPIQCLYKCIVNDLSIINKVTLSEDPLRQQDILNGIILKVDDYQSEGVYLLEIVEAMQGNEFSLASLSNGHLTKDSMSKFLLASNRSAIFHRLPIYIIDETIREQEFEKLLIDPLTDKPIDVNYIVHTGITPFDISFWENDISQFIEMIYEEDGLLGIFTSSKTMANVTFADLSTVFLYNVGNINILKDYRSYILYNMMECYSTSSISMDCLLKDSQNAPYKMSKKVYRIEELIFRNEKLLDSSGKMDKDKCMIEFHLLDKLMDTVLRDVPKLTNAQSLSTVDISFEKITSDCQQILDDGTLYRSDFGSEIVASAIDKLLNNQSLSSLFASLDNYDLYQDDYKLVNPVEGRGIDAFIRLAKADRDSIDVNGINVSYYSKSTLTPIFDLLGSKQIIAGYSIDILNYYLQQNYSLTGNSLLSTSLYSAAVSIPVLDNSDNVVLLSTVLSDETSTLSYKEMLEKADIK